MFATTAVLMLAPDVFKIVPAKDWSPVVVLFPAFAEGWLLN